jgi:Protein of unknown function (DUF2568)
MKTKEDQIPLTKLQLLNLVLRLTMETGIVVALANWGYQLGSSIGTKIFLGMGAAMLGFGFWGLIDFHQAGKRAELFRLIQELIISGLAAAAWYSAGQHAWGLALALLSIVYHILVYASGEKLLKH